MVFKCQEDSFLTEFSSKVVSCEPSEFSSVIDGKLGSISGYEVILEDTILFPEGGGQPSDQGFLNGHKVYKVLRKADKALHYTDQPLNVGEQAKQTVDWEKRFDHMQQHSGQHLVSAIIETEYKLTTVSWYLGEDVTYVELNTPTFTKEQMHFVENACNKAIREARPVSVQVYGENTPLAELENFRSARDLPEDHKGDIRVVTIEGIDSNMCCGTHVSNLSQLQAVKQLYCEKSKRKGNTLVYFLIGNRVLTKLTNSLANEAKLTALLKTNSSEHPEFVDKLLQNGKALRKNLQTLLKEIAGYEAEKVRNSDGKHYVLHKKEAEMDFLNVLVKEIGTTDKLLFLSVGDEKTVGNIMLIGDEKAVSELGPKICTLLEGKGSGKGTRFQAKVTKMSNHKEAVKLLHDYFTQ